MDALEIQKMKSDPICQKWIEYCLVEPITDNAKEYSQWLTNKQKFWEKNNGFLTSVGFNYEAGLSNALDYINISKYQRQELEGSLLIIKLGSDKRPATPHQVEVTHKLIKEALVGVKGIRVIITQHDFSVEKVNLPQLRRLQSEILTSFEEEENTNPIISNLEV